MTVLHNAPPVIVSSPVSEVHIENPPGAGYLYTVVAHDPNVGDQPTYEVTEKPGWMDFDPETHQLTGTPTAEQRGRYTGTVVVRDQDDATDQQTFEVQAHDPDPAANSLPVILNAMRTSAPIGHPFARQILATDPDGDLLTYELVSGADGMNLGRATGLFTWTPGADDITEPGSPHQITIHVVDRVGHTPLTYDLHVSQNLVNSAPVFDELPMPRRGAILNHAYVYEPSVTDADDDPVRFVLASPLADVDFDWVTGRLEWTPTKTSDLGEHQVTFAAVDPYEAYDARTWTFTVRSEGIPRT